MKKNTVVLIEDNIPLRNGFEEVINRTEDFQVVNAYSSCEEAIENLQSDDAVIFLMDIELHGMNGVEGTKQIKK